MLVTTIVNKDLFVHNVGGNLWGHFDDLNPGDTFAAMVVKGATVTC